jgi:hypothetical protein
MSHKARSVKQSSVSMNLDRGAGFVSDQLRVWNEVDELSGKMSIDSPTLAMADVYRESAAGHSEYLRAFGTREGQRGILVLIGGRVAGFDYLARKDAYRVLHPRLIESYALEAIAEARVRGKERRPDAGALRDRAAGFLESARSCEGKRYASVGRGWDYRFRGGGIVGSALLYEKTVIHAAFFSVPASNSVRHDPAISDARRRRGYRL